MHHEISVSRPVPEYFPIGTSKSTISLELSLKIQYSSTAGTSIEYEYLVLLYLRIGQLLRLSQTP